jgi:putative transposase
MAKEIKEEKKISVVRACRILSMDRTMYYYTSVKDDTEVEEKLRWYAQALPTRGFPEYFKRIRKEGIVWNHKRVKRVYKKLGMSKRKRYKRRIPVREKKALLQPIRANLTWSVDFMHDSLESGRKFRTLNIIDDYNREALAVEAGYSFTSEKVIQSITELIEWRGKPMEIRSDNGPEFIAKAFESFCENSGITHLAIQKGKPMQNGFIERFNRTYREDVLDATIFENLNQVRDVTEQWMNDYNNNHPHSSLADMSPKEFLKSKAEKQMSTLAL